MKYNQRFAAMNYRHSYHVGNFADVFKHSVLVLLIQSLHRKETPFCYLETHAGAGLYDLFSKATQKTKEYINGIDKLMLCAPLKDTPPIVKNYLEIIQNFHYPQFYPGSPAIASALLREQDRMVFMELHPEEVQNLKHLFYKDSRVAVHHQEGFAGIKAFLPPKERRGLILIDPPFEKPDEEKLIVQAIQMGLKKFSSGVYAIWYPIKERKAIETFYRSFIKAGVQSLLVAEFCIDTPKVSLGLTGCGMIIINPPWRIEQNLRILLAWLWQKLSINKKGDYRILWI